MDLIKINYQSMGNHRAIWKPFLANIAIAATGIGLIALGIQYLLNGTFFFANTQRQNQLHQLKDCMEVFTHTELTP